ncbi:hypothetical protein [Ekhidna sp.]|uniref:hypothetical protein n=1 Tax=Ekhidna sp. TaxID=2608089 RepID=UPI003BACDF45
MIEKKKTFQLFKQNSELEVLISAAIVFTAFVINDVAGDWIIKALNLNVSGDSPVLFVVAIVALYMSAILPISLISHFILRIYWLSLVGLKSVYPETKKEEVNPKFDKFINGSLNIDKQISIIDKICSSIFAFTFLTLFAFLFTFISVAIILIILQSIDDPYHIAENVGNLIILLGVIYLIDFLTLGLFKKIKKRWFAKIYYPIYRFYGWITFAGLYRGIYYTLIQYASRKVMVFITPLYIIGALYLLNYGYNAHILYPENGGYRLEDELLASTNYKDEFGDRLIMRDEFINSFVVPSNENFIKLHIPLTQDLEQNIVEKCENVAEFNPRGPHWRKWVQMGWNRVKYDSTFDYHQNAENILNCVSESLDISVDSITYSNQKFYFGQIKDPTNYAVLITVLDASDIGRGDHNLVIKSEIDGGEIIIPFWRD